MIVSASSVRFQSSLKTMCWKKITSSPNLEFTISYLMVISRCIETTSKSCHLMTIQRYSDSMITPTSSIRDRSRSELLKPSSVFNPERLVEQEVWLQMKSLLRSQRSYLISCHRLWSNQRETSNFSFQTLRELFHRCLQCLFKRWRSSTDC